MTDHKKDDEKHEDSLGKVAKVSEVAEVAEVAVSSEKGHIRGLRQAEDGHWYMPDPSRPGKYLRVE